jgi:hypothetical protein
VDVREAVGIAVGVRVNDGVPVLEGCVVSVGVTVGVVVGMVVGV